MDKNKTGGAFFKDAAMMLANNILLLAVSLLSGVLIARGLGPEGKGLYAIALLFPTLLAGLGSLGLNYAGIYFLNREPENRPYIAGSSLLYSAAAGALLSLLVAVFSGVISARFLGGSGAAYILAAAPLALLVMLVENIFHFFLASRDIKNISIYTSTRNISHLAMVAAFYFLGSLTVLKTLLSQSAALAAAIVFGVFALRAKGFFTGIAWNAPVFGRMLSFGLKQHVGTASQMLNYRIDMFIAAALLTPYQVGLYSVSVSMAELLWHIANSAGQVLYPKIAASDRSAADSFTPEVARHVFFLTLLSASGLWAAANPLTVILFGKDFLPATTALKVLLPGVVLLSVSKVIGSDISARGYPHYNSTASVISLVTAAGLSLLLIPRYGVTGAAAATAVSYLANSATMLYFFRKVSGTGLLGMFLPRKKDFVFYRDHLAAFFKRS